MFIVPPAIQAERLNTCRACKWYNKKFGTCGTPVVGSDEYDEDEIEIRNTKTHYRKKIKLCGCFMNVKTKLTFASCPAENGALSVYQRTRLTNSKSFSVP